jgi:hypothetical protein
MKMSLFRDAAWVSHSPTCIVALLLNTRGENNVKQDTDSNQDVKRRMMPA